MITRIDRDGEIGAGLASVPHDPTDTPIDGASHPKAYTAYTDATKQLTAGVWACDAGTLEIKNLPFDEICFVIDGEVVWTGSTNMSDNGFTYNHNNSIVLTSTLLADIYNIEFNEMFEQGLFGTAKSDNVTHTLDYNGIPMEIYFSPTDNALTHPR